MEPAPFAGRRIKVSAETKLVVRGQELPAQLVALSPSSALVHATVPLGAAGDVLEVFVPVVGGGDLKLTAGVDRTEKVKEGFVAAVTFMFGEASERKALDELVTFLLDGTGGGRREHPRVTYRVPALYGDGAQEAELQELSMSGTLVHVREPMTVGASLTLFVPHASGHGHLVLVAEVRNVRPAQPGWFAVGAAWKGLTDAERAELSSMLRALLSR